MNAATKPVTVLLVEDDPADAELVKLALNTWEHPNDLHHVADGLEFLKFVRCEGQYGAAPRPDIVFLDLNMPRLNGYEALKAVRADEALRNLIVVVFTTSNVQSDITRCQQAGANSFITKPFDIDNLFDVVRETVLTRDNIAHRPDLSSQ